MTEMNKVSWPGWDTVHRIGSGGFGTVYEIQRDVYGRQEKAALKVITIPHSEDEVDYLRCTGLTDANITQTLHKQVADIAREYNLMVEMRDNPNVVRCDDFRDIQHEDGLGWDIYIKMELLTPLMKCLDKVQTEEQILKLGMDMCNALIACQEKNIIHRDIKPQNIFISEKGQFKLGDFGIARTAERTTRATAGIGTYSYMAPEVEKNEAYGKTADIYSLGLVLYWLLNEKRSPFMPLPPAVPGYGDEENARNRRFSGEQIPAPKNGSEELKAIILKACAYDPKERYQSAKDMRFALEALKAGTAPVEEPVPVTVAVPTEDAVEPEGLTVGPGWGNTVEEPTAEDNMTVGPTWGDAPVTEETEVTVGSAFHEKKNKQPQTDPEDKPKDTPPKLQKKKWTILWVMVAIAAMLLAVFIFFRPSWKNINGKTYYYVNRERVTGWQTIHGHRYFFGEDGAMQTGWQPISDGWGDDWYYFGDDGIMQDGRQIIDGKVCDFSGGTLQTGWVTYDGNTYYYILNVKQTGWRIVDGVRYYFDEDGIMKICQEENPKGEVVEQHPNNSDKNRIVAIAAGNNHLVALKSDGTVCAIGENSFGQCDVSSWRNIVAISAGMNHTVGICKDGTAVATGKNNDGECNVSNWSNLVSVEAGCCHTVGVKSDGTVIATGSNINGCCDVSSWTNIVDVALFTFGTLGLRKDGKVLNTLANYMGTDECLNWSEVLEISANNSLAVGLRNDEMVLVENVWEGLDGWVPDTFEQFKNITEVAAASSNSTSHWIGGACFGLTEDGRVVSTSERGNDCVSKWTDICQIAASNHYVAGLKKDGSVLAVRYVGSSKCGVLSLSEDGDIVVENTYLAIE